MEHKTKSNFQSIFEVVKSRNTIYCIESSALTYSILPNIKKHVVNILKNESFRNEDTNFNLICFNSNVSKWCVSIVPCSEKYVTTVEEWLNTIKSEGTCNFLGAIVSALREPLVSSLCFIVTQEPDNDVDEILDLFSYIGRKIQIHVRLCLLADTITDKMKTSQKIYSQIAEETNGTFAFVKLNSENELQIINSSENILSISDSTVVSCFVDNFEEGGDGFGLKNVQGGHNKKVTNGFSCSYDPFGSVNTSPCCNWNYKPFDLWKRVSPSNQFLANLRDFNASNMSSYESIPSALAASVIIGRKVLARKYSSGQYYVGTIKEKIQSDVFNVVFGPHEWLDDQFKETDYQNTKLIDLIDYDDALKRSILPGDRVLAPDPTSNCKDLHLCRYLAGTVLEGFVMREYTGEGVSMEKKISLMSDTDTSKYLIIEFTHPLSKTETVLNDKVIHIPDAFFQRLTLETTMPKHARDNLAEVHNYPSNSLPGYPTSGSKKSPSDYTFTGMKALKSRTLQVDYLMPPYCLPLYPVIEIFEKDEATGNIISKSDWERENTVRKSLLMKRDTVLVPESIYTINELDIKIKEQLETHKDILLPKAQLENTFYRKSKGKLEKQYLTNEKKVVRIVPDLEQSEDYKSIHPKDTNYALHEEYYDEIKKIRETGQTKKDESYSSTIIDSSISRDQFQMLNVDGSVKSIRKSRTSSRISKNNNRRKDTDNSNVAPITDLGQRDKVRESMEMAKLERRQRHVERRLDEERHKFCHEERAKDRRVDHYRNRSAERIHKENILLLKEQEAIEKAQSLKRAVLTEVENKIEPAKPHPISYDEIDMRRIENLKKITDIRYNYQQQRNQDALKYIEKLEESKRNRNDARWWAAQNQMLKEFPTKN